MLVSKSEIGGDDQLQQRGCTGWSRSLGLQAMCEYFGEPEVAPHVSQHKLQQQDITLP
jgi:hypothetical protein